VRLPNPRYGAPVALVLLALAVSCGRNPEKAAHPAPSAAPPASTATVEVSDTNSRVRRPPGGRVPVIWLGLDGLDWELLDRLAAEGKMPNWKRLTSEGFTAKLKSFMPVLSPIVWTTIATGAGPDQHRVLDFQEVDPTTGQKMPISGRSRAVPAIWNVASVAGRSVGVVGWWATHPAEEVSGFFVSDHASPILFEGMPRAGVAYPAGLAAGVEQIAARDGVVSDAELGRYLDVPAEEIAQSRGAGLSNPIDAMARILGATRVQQHIARDLYDKNLPDLTMVYFEGTDVVGHVFGPYVPPKTECVPEADFARYHRAVDEYYALVDKLLGQWMRRAEEDGATLVVNSDHGFRWGKDRPCEPPSLDLSGSWHRLDGVFVAWGARVGRSSERGTASVFDVEPTIAALLDLPVDRRSSGKVLRAAFPGIADPPRKDLVETVPVRRIAAEAMSETGASDYAQKLKSLGYLSGSEPAKLAPIGGDRPGLTEVGWNNLGVYLRDNTKDLAGAETALQKSIELAPAYATPQFNLALLYRMRGDGPKAIDWLFRSFQAGHAHPEGTILYWYVEYLDRGKTALARQLLERGAQAYPGSEEIAREIGLVRYKSKDCQAAWDAVARFEPTTQSPDTLNAMGLFKTCLGRRDEAAALFRRSLAIKPGQPGAVQSLKVLEAAAQPR
jgi:predicted AlkP superfamily phosphohydrolase/phosphomutase/Tfp pilus assembly protein PilF